MPILYGTSRANDPEVAVTDLKAMIDQPEVACRLVFCSANHDVGAVGRALSRQFPDCPTIGCSTAGEIGPRGYVSNSLTGISLPASDFSAVAGLIGDIAEFDLDRTRREIAELLVTLSAKAGAPLAGHTFALLLIDGMCGQEEWLVSAIGDILGEIPLVGGSAGDNLRFQSTSVLGEGAFKADSAALLLVYTPCPFTLFATQHFVGTSQKLVVTGADPSARIVTEINGEPAAQEYARLVGLEPDLLNPMIFAAHPVVVRVGGRYYVRSIRKLNPDGSLSFFCAIDEGLVLTVAEGLDIVGSLADALTHVRDKIGPPQLIIGCDCILRRLEIDRKGLTETVSGILSANRVIGFNTYGEHIDAIHVNQTLTGIAIGSAPAPHREAEAKTTRVSSPAAPAKTCSSDTERVAALERERDKLKKINQVLADRVERAMNVQGNAFSLFQTSVVLGQVVRDRTAALTDLNARLRQEIAERLSIENALRSAKSEAERANLSKTQFFTAASHDLLQPLNAARLFSAALLQRRLAPANRALAEKLETALEAVDDLLNGLLEISKLDAGAVTPECNIFAADALLDELAAESASVARAHGIDFRYVPSGLAVESDRRLLGRIVRNFLSNAIRYTGHGRMLLGCLRRGPMLRIGVWDTGPGIPEDSLQAIFTEFRQLNVAGRGAGKGLGLGLAIVDRISRMLKHPIWVRSRMGYGSCFAVDVPLAPHPPMQQSAVRATVPVLPGTLPPGTGVLVIDDEPAICQAMENLLGGWSCHVVTAASAAEALTGLQRSRGPINLIIADYHLQDGPTGRAAIETVQAVLPAPVPALIITADRAGAGEISAGPGDPYPVLSKPVRPMQLRLLITHLLASAPSAG